MFKVMTIVGTRPELIKMSRVIAEFDIHTKHILVHTGQNYDYELNELFFNDKKDPEQWMAKKTVLKQLAKLMPKDDDRLKKAVSMDDNIEGGGYLIMDDNDTVRFVQGNIIGKKSSIYAKLMEKNVPDDLLMENNVVDL